MKYSFLTKSIAWVIAALVCLHMMPTSIAWAEPETPVPSPTPAIVATPGSEAEPTSTPAGDVPSEGEATESMDAEEQLVRKGMQCDEVILLQMRLRDLGYFNYKITDYFGSYTEDAVKAFQKENGLSQDGVMGPNTFDILFSNDAKRAPVKEVIKPTPTPRKLPGSVKTVPKGKLMEWNKGKNLFPRGTSTSVIDVYTRVQYSMTRVGGSKHFNVEPTTKTDCARLKSTYGGTWSWTRRPVVIKLNGTWVAGSTNGMPHGYETVKNNGMTGQVCIHLLNSATHIRGIPDAAHQRCVKIAAGK